MDQGGKAKFCSPGCEWTTGNKVFPPGIPQGPWWEEGLVLIGVFVFLSVYLSGGSGGSEEVSWSTAAVRGSQWSIPR